MAGHKEEKQKYGRNGNDVYWPYRATDMYDTVLESRLNERTKFHAKLETSLKRFEPPRGWDFVPTNRFGI